MDGLLLLPCPLIQWPYTGCPMRAWLQIKQLSAGEAALIVAGSWRLPADLALCSQEQVLA